MDLGLKGARVLVAGAGGRPPRPGFGRVAALKMAAEGARIACLDFDEERARAVTEEVRAVGGEAITIVADMTKREEVERSVDEVVKAFGGLDISIDIIVGARWGRGRELDDDDGSGTMEPILRQNFLLFRAAGAQMVKRATGGARVAVASVDGLN